ncbi:MAG: 4-hydroxy-tetrahydrodipicolinate synthase [Rhodothalassiaceae bacterium]
MLRGSITALVTPFRDGVVDWEAFEKFVDWQIAEGSRGLVPCGTTGESPTLSAEEHAAVIECCVRVAAGRVPVIAGCGTNTTATTIARVRHAETAGADAVLVVVPYYNKPSQEGLYRHYAAIHEASGLPIVIYNIPGRTGVDMSVETMARLAELPRIIGVKDATGDLSRIARQRHVTGPELIQLSGEDITALGFNAMGGAGCISVTANVAPRLCADMQEAALAGDIGRARAIHDRLLPLHLALFCDTNPVPVKYAAARLGLARDEVRPPLAPLSDANRARVDAALEAAGLASD